MNVKNSLYIITVAAGASLLSSPEARAQSAAQPFDLRTTMAASGVTTIIGNAKSPDWPTTLSTMVALRVTDPSVHSPAVATAPGSTPAPVKAEARASAKIETKVETRVASKVLDTTIVPVKSDVPAAAARPAAVSPAPAAVARPAQGMTGPLRLVAVPLAATPVVAVPPVVASTATARGGVAPSTPAAASAAAASARQARLPQATASQPPVVAPAKPTILPSRHKDRLLLEQMQRDLLRSERRLNLANTRLTEGQRQLASLGNVMRQAMLEAGPDAKGLHPFVRVAQRYAGTPYVWGGESGRGFDCSGFIIRVMRDLGYRSLPHSAAEQFNYGMPVAQALLKPGDLVFFANTYKPGISHVGIYLGKRRFIHAAGTGTGTIVSSLDSSKYAAKYAGARRLNTAR